MPERYNDITPERIAETNAKWQAAYDKIEQEAHDMFIAAMTKFAVLIMNRFPARSTLMVRRLKRLRANTST